MTEDEFYNRKIVKYADIMQLEYLGNNGINICNYVTNVMIPPYNNLIHFGNRISLNRMLNQSLEYIKLFGNDITHRAAAIIFSVPFHPINEQLYYFTTEITYEIIDNSYCVKDSGMITGFQIPKKLYEYSTINFGHEICHSLKDTNYEEHRYIYSLGETIPLFYELISLNPNDIYSKDMIKTRLFFLYRQGLEFMLNKDLINVEKRVNDSKSNGDKNSYQFMLSKIGCYIHSFYYAIILYNMYKETPQRILKLANKVLNHEMTTLEMLVQLNILNDIRGEVFEKELGLVRKLIK